MITPVNAPPKPARAPDVHLKNPSSRKPPRTLKGDLRALKDKASSARVKWAEGRASAESKKEKVRREAGEIRVPVKKKVSEEAEIAGEVVKPVFKATQAAKAALDPANGRTRPYVTSFMISLAASWAVGPQILTALYERIRFGTNTTSWGFLQGPGRWFRDTVGMAYETGQMVGLISAVIVGLAPMLLMNVRNMTAGHFARSSYRGRGADFVIRLLARLPYMVPVVFLVGVSYPDYVQALFGQAWTLEWWQFWVAGLFCIAYYCTMWAFDRIERLHRERLVLSEEERKATQSMGPGLFHALLMVPLASIVSGVLYAPGAAW